MGILAEDIHNPSIPSTSSTNGSSFSTFSGKTPTRDDILKLMEQKDLVEGELNALGAVLESHNVHMNTTLTTFDGYPRDDIDVALIRTTRARIIHLRNDHKALMKTIEQSLHALHESSRQANLPPPVLPRTTATETTLVEAPFARVDSVTTGSPAEQAGLMAGDRIKRFGGVGALNHEKLSMVAREVQANEGKEIKVLVNRKVEAAETDVELTLTPRKDWGGRGMLGCHLLPI